MAEVSWVPTQLVLFSLPAVVVAAVARRRRPWAAVLDRLGLRGSPREWLVTGLLVGVLAGVAGALAVEPLTGAVDDPRFTLSEYAGLELGPAAALLVLVREAFYTNLGEELLFRGLLGGWLFPRFGFRAGNLVQAALFLVPHLPALVLGWRAVPVTASIAVGGWAMGWLRHRSGSILPGWIAHTVGDTLATLAILR